VDGNSDGVSQPNELKSLDSLGITQLSLAASSSTATDNGNLIGLTSSYQTADGSSHQMADVWFATAATTTNTESLSSNVASLSQIISSYKAADSGNGAGNSNDSLPLPDTTSQLSALAGAMVDTLKAFDANGQALTSSPLATPATPASKLPEVKLGNDLSSGILPTLGSGKG
jgi:hypothetical protein